MLEGVRVRRFQEDNGLSFTITGRRLSEVLARTTVLSELYNNYNLVLTHSKTKKKKHRITIVVDRAF